MSLPFTLCYPRLHCSVRETLSLAPFEYAGNPEIVHAALTPTGSLTFISEVAGSLQPVISLSKSGSSPSS